MINVKIGKKNMQIISTKLISLIFEEFLQIDFIKRLQTL